MDETISGVQTMAGPTGQLLPPTAPTQIAPNVSISSDAIQSSLPNTFDAFKSLDPSQTDADVAMHIAAIKMNMPNLTDQQGVQLATEIGSGTHDNAIKNEMLNGATNQVQSGAQPDLGTALTSMHQNAPAWVQNALSGGNGPANTNTPSTPTQGSNPPTPDSAPTADSIAQQLKTAHPDMPDDVIQQTAQQLYSKFAAQIAPNGQYSDAALANAQSAGNQGQIAAGLFGGKTSVNPAADLLAQRDLSLKNTAGIQGVMGQQNELSAQMQQKDPNSMASQITRNILGQVMPTMAKTPGFDQTSAFQLMSAIPPQLSSLVSAQVDQQIKLMGAQSAQQTANAKTTEANTSAAALANKGSPAQEAIDTNFGKDYADYVAGGGAAQVNKSISQVQDALNSASKKGTPVSTGGGAGVIQSNFPKTGNLLYPSTTEARQQIEGAVATTLKQLFPGRILQSEVENTMSRVWNPQLPLEDNIKNSQGLLTQLKAANDAKQNAAAYYEKNGTLKGFQGKLPTPEDFTGGGSSTPSSGSVAMTLNGKTKMVPANQVDAAKAMGATLAGG